MSFREYMRWEGYVAVLVGGALCVFGLANGHQGAADAAVSGTMMLAGTGVFMMVRHRAPFRRPGTWFTAKPMAAAIHDRAPCSRRSLLAWLLAEVTAFTILTVGLSYLTSFWLTYVDFGIWAVAIGVIKIGPATAAIGQYEARAGTTYRVARRPLRGLVELAGG
ncbi:MAG TPA: hypothetical protein VFM58_20865 [Solirubrobacteraceae bacterium]|nr:hypothetical protein [Solirubrobacteraceae bacterium]